MLNDVEIWVEGKVERSSFPLIKSRFDSEEIHIPYRDLKENTLFSDDAN